ncbi:MAG: Unknown protein, partial [uncultured Aureispira sp.]
MNYYTQITQQKKNATKNLLLKFGIGLFFLLLGTTTQGQATQLQWAKRMGSSDNYGVCQGTSIDVDRAGNVYTSGYFNDTADFDPNAGVFNLATGVHSQQFIQKLDANGNFVWAKQMGGRANAIFVDDSSNVYTTGFFSDTVDFDPNAGVYNLASLGNSDIYVQKLDSAGNLIWAKRMGGTRSDAGNAIVVDNLGNVYTTGYFLYTADFDPNAGVFNLSGGNTGMFLQKLDAAGNFVWAKSLNSNLGFIRGHNLDLGALGHIYIVGEFQETVDFNPNAGVSNLTAINGYDRFIQKLDTAGNFIWAKNISPVNYAIYDQGYSIAVDDEENIYTTGKFEHNVDFDPNAGTHYLSAVDLDDIFVQKLDAAGNFLWAKSMGGSGNDFGRGIDLDAAGNVYITGFFSGTIDFDPSPRLSNLTSMGSEDIFIQKLDFNGNFLWAKNMGGFSYDYGNDIAVDLNENVHTTGMFLFTADFDPNADTFNLIANGNSNDVFIQKLSQKGITGHTFLDFNQNCIQDNNEADVSGRRLIIKPGNILVTTRQGHWYLDSLPTGTYTIEVDTSNYWTATCSNIQSFTVVHPDSLLITPSFGLISTRNCPAPDVSIYAPFLRPGFSNQRISVQACNQNIGTGTLDSAYVIVTLDSLLTVQAASLPFSSLGNNQYRINVDTIYPDFCVDFWLECQLNMTATIGQSLCMSAELFPVYACSLDSIPSPSTNSCLTPYDNSHISIKGFCINDTIQFIVYNTGTSPMTCFSPVRLYIDGQYVLLDSVQLVNGQTRTFLFPGDGRTWRLEVDQHPLHPGNSQPSQTIELCGSAGNWTPNLVNILPQDDADPVIDIYCGLVTGSYDPNDKKGYPLGIGNTYDILPNQDLEYLIRFQNTGTDTAFTVVIRDTLSEDLDIFSIRSGVSSHEYSFRMYGPRVLEWTFNTIMLADSNVNEPASHGFVQFKVKQNANLPIGTEITNKAAIYFDFNAPIITNTYLHTINVPQVLNWDGEDTLVVAICDSFNFRGLTYRSTGTYFFPVNNNNLDSLYTIHLTILNPTSETLRVDSCTRYTAPDGQIYTTSGQYTAVIPNVVGCDSIITINLTLKDSTASTITVHSCTPYIAPDGQTYTANGQYIATIPNVVGCDSIITINLTLKDSTTSTITVNSCSSYTAPDGQIYTASGQYTATIPNFVGCDSVITINLTLRSTDSTISANP